MIQAVGVSTRSVAAVKMNINRSGNPQRKNQDDNSMGEQETAIQKNTLRAEDNAMEHGGGMRGKIVC